MFQKQFENDKKVNGFPKSKLLNPRPATNYKLFREHRPRPADGALQSFGVSKSLEVSLTFSIKINYFKGLFI